MKPRIVFATTVFQDVATGPGMYAQYLWQAFGDDPEIEFHLVAPAAEERHPRLHTLDAADTAGSIYERIAHRALQVAGQREGTIIHSNAAHASGAFVGYAGPWAVQVNDYEVADVTRHMAATLLGKGPRRLASLLWRRRQERRVVAATCEVVCNSQYTRQRVLDAYGADADRVCTIYKAVDTQAFKRPAALGADPLGGRKGPRIALVGTNWQLKGLDTLLKAMPRLLHRHPRATLAVAGAPRDSVNVRMIDLYRRLNLGDSVTFVGRLDRSALAAMLWHSDLFVLPSRCEGFGVAVLEAMGAGVAVVASNVGGLPEIVGHRWGVLVEPDQPQALAEAIDALLSDDARRGQLAAAGPQRAGEFDLQHMISGVRALYSRLNGGGDRQQHG
ncbi:MAG: glycosyltransferase family 4 protein [Planctomycetaceae bacterium]|nr:glycosyltransferase family 4 protein [Planctomycetaceae bacterium]